MTNTSIKHPLLRSQIYIWEGYWTGWQLRVCNLDKGNLTIFRDDKQSDVQLVIPINGTNLEFSFMNDNESNIAESLQRNHQYSQQLVEETVESTREDLYLLSFTVTGDKIKHNVQMKMKNQRDRDLWMLRLSQANSENERLQIQSKLDLIQTCRDVLVSENSKLKMKGHMLTEYPEVATMVTESRVLMMNSSTLLTTLSDGIENLADIEDNYLIFIEKEKTKQNEYCTMIDVLNKQGFNINSNITHEEVNVFIQQQSDQTESVNEQERFISVLNSSKLSLLSMSADVMKSQTTLFSARLSTLHLLVTKLLSSYTLDPDYVDNERSELKSNNGSHHGRPITPPFNFESSASEIYSAHRPGDNSFDTRSLHSGYHYQSPSVISAPYSYMAPPGSYGSRLGILEQAYKEFIIFDTALKTMNVEYNQALADIRTQLALWNDAWLFEKYKANLLHQRLMDGLGSSKGDNDSDDEEDDPSDGETLSREFIGHKRFNLPIEALYDEFFGDNAREMLRLYDELEYYSIEVEDWDSDFNRNAKFSVDIDSPLGRKTANNIEKAWLRWKRRKSGFVFQNELQAPNVPYGSTFINKAQYRVKKIDDSSCYVTFSAEVFFVSPPFLSKIKNMIEDVAYENIGNFASKWAAAVTRTEQRYQGGGNGNAVNIEVNNDLKKEHEVEKEENSQTRVADTVKKQKAREIKHTISKRKNDLTSSSSTLPPSSWEEIFTTGLVFAFAGIALVSFFTAAKSLR